MALPEGGSFLRIIEECAEAQVLISRLHATLVTVPLLVSQLSLLRAVVSELVLRIEACESDALAHLELRQYAEGLRPFLSLIDGEEVKRAG